ncbi:MAG TPA: biotin transporter BioY, partial [Candidatus Limnocylindria bacterium]|nr:biotin transporter BioY [Candidatus Limnocylindria bacterium]
MTAAAPARPRVLADLLPGALLRDVLLVIGAAVLTGVAAQISIPLPFTPVPITLQTFTVLLAGAVLGPWRAGAAMLLYLVAGVAGVPWFAEQGSGM